MKSTRAALTLCLCLAGCQSAGLTTTLRDPQPAPHVRPIAQVLPDGSVKEFRRGSLPHGAIANSPQRTLPPEAQSADRIQPVAAASQPVADRRPAVQLLGVEQVAASPDQRHANSSSAMPGRLAPQADPPIVALQPPAALDDPARPFDRPASWTRGSSYAGQMPDYLTAPTQGCTGLPECGACDSCCDGRYHLGGDLRRFGCMIHSDTKALVNWDNALILGLAAGGAIALRQDADREVREYTAEHADRWGEGSKTLGKLGDLPVQVPTILGVYSYGVWKQDARTQQFGETLISAYTINGVTTVLIKAAANTDRPSDEWNGGHFGFPSFHTSSSFTLASVVDEYYGPGAGIPAYALAGLIGWSRIDERDHDLSDVCFGAVLGYVIGKSVARHHLYGDGRVQLLPYVHPTDGTTGVMFETRY